MPGGDAVLKGNLDPHRQARPAVGELEPMAVAVEALEPSARVREADAAAQPRACARVQPDAVVPDFEPERVVFAPDAICTCPGPLRGAMPCLIAFSTSGCRIRRGHFGVERLGIDLELRPSDDPGSASVRSRDTSAGTPAPPAAAPCVAPDCDRR